MYHDCASLNAHKALLHTMAFYNYCKIRKLMCHVTYLNLKLFILNLNTLSRAFKVFEQPKVDPMLAVGIWKRKEQTLLRCSASSATRAGCRSVSAGSGPGSDPVQVFRVFGVFSRVFSTCSGVFRWFVQS